MNIVKKQYIIDLMETQQLRFFTIYGSDGKSLIYDHQNEDGTVESAQNELINTLDNIEDGIVYIKVSGVSKQTKGAGGKTRSEGRNFEFRVRISSTEINGKRSTNESGINPHILSLMNQNAELRSQLMMKDFDRKIEDIKREHKEKDGESPLIQYIPQVLAGLGWMPPAAGATIAAPSINGDHEQSAKEKIQDAIYRLAKIDKDLPNTLQSLAAFAEKDPNKFLSFLPMIKAM